MNKKEEKNTAASKGTRDTEPLLKIINAVPAMVGYWDKDLRNLFSNNPYSSWFGHSPEKILGRHIKEVLGEELYKQNLPYIEGVLRGERQRFERAIPTLDGHAIKYALAEYIPDIIDGEVHGFIAHVTDISSLKETEFALRKSNDKLKVLEERFRTVLEDQAEVISRLTGDGVYIYANEVFLRFFGLSEEELIGSRWQPIVYPDDLERVTNELARLSPENPLVMIENRVYSGTHQVHWMEFSNRGKFDSAGHLTEIQSVGRDITKRKEIEHKAQVLEDKFRKAFMTSVDALYLATLHDGKIIEVNDSFLNVFGYTREEAVGKTSIELGLYANPDDRKKWVSEMESTGKIRNVKLNCIKKGGEEIVILLSVSLTEEVDGNVILGVVRDITDQVRTEKRLRESLLQSIQALAGTLEARDPYTAGHQRRVANLSIAIAKELGLTGERLTAIELAAIVHDLGKIQIPAEILSKPGKMSDLEYNLIKTHPESGYNILKDIDFPWPIADIVRQHHEKLDGSGYPHGLKGNQILLESRILSVADIVEAMASHRPYRPALGIEKAVEELEKGRGTAFDPIVVDTCVRLFREGKFAFHT